MKFKVPMTFSFEGLFSIEADTPEEARAKVEKHCGLVIGDIHSTLPDNEVDWEFDTHPQKRVGEPFKA